MALVSTIIRDAYRESNLIAIGTQPSAAQQDEALRLLNRIVASYYTLDYFYDSETETWPTYTDLTASDECPFEEAFEDLFVTALAMRLNPRYAQLADPQTLARFKQQERQFKARYKQERQMRSELALILTNSNREVDAESLTPGEEFESGIPYSTYS